MSAFAIWRTSYRPNRLAQAVRTGRSGMIGIVRSGIVSQFDAERIAALTEAIQAQGYYPLLAAMARGALPSPDAMRVRMSLPVDRAPYDPEKFRFGPRNSTGELNHGWTPINRDVHWEAYPHAGVIRRRMISRQESTVSPSKYRRCQISTFRRIQRRKLWSALPSWCSSTSRRT